MKKIILLFLLLSPFFIFSQTIPKLKGHVSDYENLFTPEQNQNLTKMLSDYKNETTIEIAILTVPDFESDIADFAQKTATEWKLGQSGVNNGMLIVVSKNRGVLRSQTGYGLEGYLPDGWLKHTGDSIVYKYLKQDKFYEGMVSFLDQTKERIGKEGYSVDHNKELIEKNKQSVKGESLFEQLLKIMPWWGWALIVIGWIIWLIIDPSSALWILFIFFDKDGDGSSGGSSVGGGGKFGGGGSFSKW